MTAPLRHTAAAVREGVVGRDKPPALPQVIAERNAALKALICHWATEDVAEAERIDSTGLALAGVPDGEGHARDQGLTDHAWLAFAGGLAGRR